MKKDFYKLSEELRGFLKENLIIWFFSFTCWLKFLEFNRLLKTFSNKPIFLYATLAICLILFVPITFLKKKKSVVAILLNVLLVGIIISNLVYLRYFNSLPTIENLAQIGNSSEIKDSILALLKPSDAFLFIDLLVLSLLLFLTRGKKSVPAKQRWFFPALATFTALGLLLPVYYVDKNYYLPFYVNRVYDNKMTTERYGLIGAQAIDIYRKVITKTRLVGAEKQTVVGEIKNNYFNAQQPNQFTGKAKGKNVVAIQVESLEASVIGKKIEGQEITPNLNRLLAESHYFSNHYFEMGFGNTSDTDFTFNTSLYPLLDASTFMKYGKQQYSSLPKYLAEEGYSLTAFHAYNKSFWNRGTAYQSLGYEKFYFSKNYTGSVVGMGINDRDFFAQTYDYAKDQKKPSFNYIVSLSSHFPFSLPAGTEKLKINQPIDPTFANYYRSINYADSALGEFLDKYKKDGRYEDTMFVVFGDHYAKKADRPKNAQDSIEQKRVPLIIKLPGQNEPALHRELSSTIDIMPTILNLIGYKKPFLHFGRDLFGNLESFFVGSVYFGNGVLADSSHFYVMGGTSDISRGECYLARGWQRVKNTDCSNLLEKRNKDYKYSSALIKYNLFREIK